MINRFTNCLGVGGAAAMLWASSVSAQTTSVIPTTPGVHNLQFVDTANPLAGTRDYTLRLPTGYVHSSTTSYRVVLLLHGGGQTVGDFLSKPHMTDFATRADASDVILVAPQGYIRSWNAGHCCGLASIFNINDVAFIQDLMNELVGALNIDEHGIHMVGYSNGGMMVHRLAAELSSLFASGATVAGPVGGFAATVPSPLCHPYDSSCSDWQPLSTPTQTGGPIPMMMIRGMRDEVIPYEGGASRLYVWHLPAIANTAAPTETDYAYWVDFNGCTEKDPYYYSQGQLRDCEATAPDQADVRMVSLHGMTHKWPTKTNSADFDAVEQIVEFLNAHPKP